MSGRPLQLVQTRRIGARARARDRRDPAGEGRRPLDLADAREVRAPEALTTPAGEERAHEGVAGVDRVDHVDRRRGDPDDLGPGDDERSGAAEGDEGDRARVAEHRPRGRVGHDQVVKGAERSDPRRIADTLRSGDG